MRILLPTFPSEKGYIERELANESTFEIKLMFLESEPKMIERLPHSGAKGGKKVFLNLTTTFSRRLIENHLFFSAFTPLYNSSIIATSQTASVLWAIQGINIEK